jgi:hypothetical protein
MPLTNIFNKAASIVFKIFCCSSSLLKRFSMHRGCELALESGAGGFRGRY